MVTLPRRGFLRSWYSKPWIVPLQGRALLPAESEYGNHVRFKDTAGRRKARTVWSTSPRPGARPRTNRVRDVLPYEKASAAGRW